MIKLNVPYWAVVKFDGTIVFRSEDRETVEEICKNAPETVYLVKALTCQILPHKEESYDKTDDRVSPIESMSGGKLDLDKLKEADRKLKISEADRKLKELEAKLKEAELNMQKEQEQEKLKADRFWKKEDGFPAPIY
jgi:hypothetical protein